MSIRPPNPWVVSVPAIIGIGRGEMLKRVLLVAALALAQSRIVVAFQVQGNWAGCRAQLQRGQLQRAAALPQAACPASRQGGLQLSMGLRDKAKKVVATVIAGVTFAYFPGSASAKFREAPRLVLPSQEAYYRNPSKPLAGSGPLALVTSPIFAGTVAILTAGAVGSSMYRSHTKEELAELKAQIQTGLSSGSTKTVEALLRPTAVAVASVFTAAEKSATLMRSKLPSKGAKPPPNKKWKPYDGYNPAKRQGSHSYKSGFSMPSITPPDLKSKTQTLIKALTPTFKPKAGPAQAAPVKAAAVAPAPAPAAPAPKAAPKNMDVDAILADAIADPASVNPSDLAAILPQLQKDLDAVVRAGISPAEIKEVRMSFVDMGIDVDELFKSLDRLEASGKDSALGKDGKEFFQTLRKILVA